MTARNVPLTLLALVVTAMVAVVGCFGGESVSRSEVLESLVPNVVVPAHVKLRTVSSRYMMRLGEFAPTRTRTM